MPLKPYTLKLYEYQLKFLHSLTKRHASASLYVRNLIDKAMREQGYNVQKLRNVEVTALALQVETEEHAKVQALQQATTAQHEAERQAKLAAAQQLYSKIEKAVLNNKNVPSTGEMLVLYEDKDIVLELLEQEEDKGVWSVSVLSTAFSAYDIEFGTEAKTAEEARQAALAELKKRLLRA